MIKTTEAADLPPFYCDLCGSHFELASIAEWHEAHAHVLPTAERAVLAVLVLHDRDHWCYDLDGGSSWYSSRHRPPTRPRWPCLTLEAIRGAGYPT